MAVKETKDSVLITETKNSKVLFDFFIYFLLGSIIIGFWESFSIQYGFTWITQFKSARAVVLYTFFYYFIGLGYTGFALKLLFDDLKITTYKKVLSTFLIIYYVLFVYIFSYFHYLSPISYVTSYIYNGISNSNISANIKSSLMNKNSNIINIRKNQ